jgi:pseudouridylate synthase
MRVALESTVIAHGLPHPENVQVALDLERIVRSEGGEPNTIGILNGEIVPAMTESQIRHLAEAPGVRKVSLRDLPVVTARKLTGATTVAATCWIAHRHSIYVMATGGIGGVHRAPTNQPHAFDVSTDLDVLAQVPITVVCSGAKSILDLPATREVLETRGVTVIGYGTDEMPAFYSRESGLPVDARCDTPEDVVAIILARRRLGLPAATLVMVPIPEEHAMLRSEIDPAIEDALREAEARRLASAQVTPFLLARLRELTGNRTLAANVALLKNNARVAARIAMALGTL